MHICNYCDFASVQAGDLRARVKTHNRRNHKYATNVSLHLFKQAMWRHVKTNISENRSHATNVTLHLFNTTFDLKIIIKKYRTYVQAGDLKRHVNTNI